MAGKVEGGSKLSRQSDRYVEISSIRADSVQAEPGSHPETLAHFGNQH